MALSPDLEPPRLMAEAEQSPHQGAAQPPAALVGDRDGWEALAVQARDYARAAKAPSTLRAYAADWRHFRQWCAAYNLQSLPALLNDRA